jgi:hypothetical protein
MHSPHDRRSTWVLFSRGFRGCRLAFKGSISYRIRGQHCIDDITCTGWIQVCLQDEHVTAEWGIRVMIGEVASLWDPFPLLLSFHRYWQGNTIHVVYQ